MIVRKMIAGKNFTLFTFMVASLMISCSVDEKNVFTDPQEYFDKGVKAFDKKKWDKAIENFNMVILNSPGGELADDSQLKLGDCYFNKKEYLLAISEYQQLVERYSYSPFAEEAYYKTALSYFKISPKYPLDQDNTLKAFQYMQDFLDTYPTSEYLEAAEEKIDEIRGKLAKKIYESGYLYIKMQEWDSAILYFDDLLEQYYDTQWAYMAKIKKAYCYVRMRNFDDYKKLLSDIKSDGEYETYKTDVAFVERSYESEHKKIEKEEKKRKK